MRVDCANSRIPCRITVEICDASVALNLVFANLRVIVNVMRAISHTCLNRARCPIGRVQFYKHTFTSDRRSRMHCIDKLRKETRRCISSQPSYVALSFGSKQVALEGALGDGKRFSSRVLYNFRRTLLFILFIYFLFRGVNGCAQVLFYFKEAMELRRTCEGRWCGDVELFYVDV